MEVRFQTLLRWDFIDTDTLLSERFGMPVGQILVEFGEQRFREMESEALFLAANNERVVIATGGGAVISEANRIFMREHGLTFYLETSVEIAWQRVQEQINQSGKEAERPLVVGTDGQQRLQSLFLTRKKWYEEAVVCINTNDDSLEIISKRVVAFALSSGYLNDSSQSQETVILQTWKGYIQSYHRMGWTVSPARIFEIIGIFTTYLYRHGLRRRSPL